MFDPKFKDYIIADIKASDEKTKRQVKLIKTVVLGGLVVVGIMALGVIGFVTWMLT